MEEVAPEVQALHKRFEPRYPIENIEAYEKSYAKNEKLGWLTGFEPATTRSTILYSNQLSYSHHIF